ncbi:MAG: response regulator [Actinomycetota bacterium]
MSDLEPTMHALLVEDEPDMRMLIKAYLRRDPRIQIMGEAASADQALALVREDPPRLIILDHSIEGEIMGLAVAPRLRELAPDSKILFFTAFNMAGEAQAEPAVDAYLSKSDMPKLLLTVQELLGLLPLQCEISR